MAMGNYNNSRVFNFAILLKSRKFDAREIYLFYGALHDMARVTVWVRDRVRAEICKLCMCNVEIVQHLF